MKMCLANAVGSIYVGERDLLLESKLLQVHPLNMTMRQHCSWWLHYHSLIKEESGHIFFKL